ncbi:hypothetical protein M2325_000648 [Methanococcus voltae PS]|uniref:Uncharacterized protein n=1 Tax=Methanococcus voltae PS TaxID=523842 RepID=A0ABT2EVH5_METVO|nr:hypothetical protein [Methanococcus voltae]MCS3921963.1 hypothetical protein [Methanococcus voltae PS]
MSKKIDKDLFELYPLYHSNEIEGNKKYMKICYEMECNLYDEGYQDIIHNDFKRNQFGPNNGGILDKLTAYSILKKVILKEINGIKSWEITSGGISFLKSRISFFKKTNDNGELIIENMEKVVLNTKNKSGYELEKGENVQKYKKETFWGDDKIIR